MLVTFTQDSNIVYKPASNEKRPVPLKINFFLLNLQRLIFLLHLAIVAVYLQRLRLLERIRDVKCRGLDRTIALLFVGVVIKIVDCKDV